MPGALLQEQQLQEFAHYRITHINIKDIKNEGRIQRV